MNRINGVCNKGSGVSILDKLHEITITWLAPYGQDIESQDSFQIYDDGAVSIEHIGAGKLNKRHTQCIHRCITTKKMLFVLKYRLSTFVKF